MTILKCSAATCLYNEESALFQRRDQCYGRKCKKCRMKHPAAASVREAKVL